MYHDPLDAPSEALANSLTHGLGLSLSIAAAIALLTAATTRGTVMHVVSCAIYAASLVLVYFSSTLYHSVSSPALRRIFRTLDHSAIYLLIAGTYTPFAFAALPRGVGWTLLMVIWSCAVAGILASCVALGRFPVLNTAFYLFMGWLVLFCGKSILTSVSQRGFAWILAGGLFYSIGVFFFASKRIYQAHAIWHLFVLAGSACHFWAVFRYVVPQVA